MNSNVVYGFISSRRRGPENKTKKEGNYVGSWKHMLAF